MSDLNVRFDKKKSVDSVIVGSNLDKTFKSYRN